MGLVQILTIHTHVVGLLGAGCHATVWNEAMVPDTAPRGMWSTETAATNHPGKKSYVGISSPASHKANKMTSESRGSSRNLLPEKEAGLRAEG